MPSNLVFIISVLENKGVSQSGYLFMHIHKWVYVYFYFVKEQGAIMVFSFFLF